VDLISVSQEKGQKFKISVRKHSFYSDMSAQDQGNDEAPSPAELLVSAYGACVGMLIDRYCESHGLSSENVNLDLTYELDNKPRRVKNITIDVSLPESFPENRKGVIRNLAKTCVIHNTLNNPPDIDMEIVSD